MSDETVDEGPDIACRFKWVTRIIGAIGGVSSVIGGILGMRFDFCSLPKNLDFLYYSDWYIL